MSILCTRDKPRNFALVGRLATDKEYETANMIHRSNLDSVILGSPVNPLLNQICESDEIPSLLLRHGKRFSRYCAGTGLVFPPKPVALLKIPTLNGAIYFDWNACSFRLL